MGDGDFSLSKYLIKRCRKDEIRANTYLSEWEKRAFATRKPIKCAFGIIKNRFCTPKVGTKLENEDEADYGMCDTT